MSRYPGNILVTAAGGGIPLKIDLRHKYRQ
jgi:hypothetical protein